MKDKKLQQIPRPEVKFDEYYLVYTGLDWSGSGYDIAIGSANATLISQSNNEDITSYAEKIYKLF